MTTTASTLIDLSPIITTVISGIVAVVLSLAGLAIHKLNLWISAKTGHQNLINEDTVRGYLHTALDNAAQYAISKVGSTDWSHVDTKNALVAEAANYALAHVPDALAYFKLDGANLEAALEARLAKLLGLAS